MLSRRGTVRALPQRPPFNPRRVRPKLTSSLAALFAENREIHQTIPDHRVKLTQDGWTQAYEAGRRLRKMLRADDTLHFFTSPYRRTRETTEGILATLTGDDPDPSPFKRNNIKVYEEPRLREQDFGNFQPCSAEMERMWQERADYGHFFYRIPNGESAADAYDRVSGFNESLWRQFGEDEFASVCVLVTHGLMSRVFLMKWYHFSVEYFEDLRNVNHCEFLIMRKQEESGKYLLENKLRTWSELRRERAVKDKEKEKQGKDKDGSGGGGGGGVSMKDLSKTERKASITIPRRWGGCPNGCTHGKDFKIRSDLADLVRTSDQLSDHAASVPLLTRATVVASISAPVSVNNDSDSVSTTPALETGSTTPATTIAPAIPTIGSEAVAQTIISRRPAAKRFQSFISDVGQECVDTDGDIDSGDIDNSELDDPRQRLTHGPRIDVMRSKEDVVSSPDGTPSFISPDHRIRSLKSPPAANGIVLTTTTLADTLGGAPLSRRSGDVPAMHLHLGRDFGGTYSGHASQAGSSEEDNAAIATAGGAGRPCHGPGGVKPSRSLGVGKMKQNSAAAVAAAAAALEAESSSSEESGMARGARACRLGDAPHSSDAEADADADDEGDDEISQAERHDRSIQGSVY
ncbi:Broad-range acid phosphatase DET1 [Zalerion maritima]|uniref:Broad-range acid phosphatase DET1 n=1 Tax=Zalerion maritima TaxID=339359 RepID=A0AAD5RK35_9PEZI|nr:Broad-range acid phosphatase DET1 [Zalerion maritima]